MAVANSIPSIAVHTLAFAIGIICYTVLTVLGHDGTPVLAATLGYTGGAIVENKVGNGVKTAS